MVDEVHNSSVRLIEIVNDFLDTSRLEQGKITFKLQKFSLDRVLEQVLYEMGSVLREKGLYCNVDEHITKLDSLGDHLKVVVSDTGPGIPIENQKLLFHKFQQAGSSLLTRDTTRGTGLGLYISKLLAQGMSGSLRFESSTLGKGTTFSFTLPIVTGDNQQADGAAKQLVATETTTSAPIKT